MSAVTNKLEPLNSNLTDNLTISVEAVSFSPGVARRIAKIIACALF